MNRYIYLTILFTLIISYFAYAEPSDTLDPELLPAMAKFTDESIPDSTKLILNTEMARQSELRTVKGSVVMSIIGDESAEFTCGFARDFAKGARMEIHGIFGEVLYILTATGDDMMLHDKLSKVAIICPATHNNLKVLLGLDVGGDIFEILDWIAATVPLRISEVNDGTLTLSEEIVENKDGKLVKISWTKADGVPEQFVYFDTELGIPTAARVYDETGTAYADVIYANFKDVNGIKFAHNIILVTDALRTDIIVKKITFNADISEKAFSISPPKGVKVISVEEGPEVFSPE